MEDPALAGPAWDEIAKGRRFETWEQIAQAVEAATAYWNTHRHPFVWGRGRRHRPRRKAGLAVLPTAA